MLGGISVSHLRRLMDAGELRPFDMNTSPQPRKRGKLFFLVSDIEAFVERYAKRDQPTSPVSS
ncbi:helix-turn-helix domain-containing protein [Nitrobacter vulgaris]